MAGIISPFLLKRDLGGGPQGPLQGCGGSGGFSGRHPFCFWMLELEAKRGGLAGEKTGRQCNISDENA